MGRGFLERGRLSTGVAEMTEGLSSQAQRALVLDVFFLDGAVLVPEIEYGSDDDPDTQTAEEEPAVGRKPDQEGQDQRPPRRSELLRLGENFWPLLVQNSVPQKYPDFILSEDGEP